MATVCLDERARRAGPHRTRRSRAGANAVLAALLVVTTFAAVLVDSAPPAAADPTAADVLGGATALGTSVASPDVAAGANGNFHAVARDASFGGTRITYLRSADGGRTWVRQAILSGTIGATRPSIAADGDHVAVTFVGAWVDGAGVHGEAPYLTTSDDGGASWTPARRLGTWATDVDVAVDGDRVWVIWDGVGGLRGTDDGGATFFVSRELTGVARAAIAAGDGVVSMAYLDGAGDTRLAVAQGRAIGMFHTVDGAVLQDVAAADGQAYVLVAAGADLSVLAASPGGSPARAQVPAPAGGALGGGVVTTLWADLAAGRGTLAVATCLAGTVYVTESTDWPTFSEPTAVTTFDDAEGQPCRAVIAAPPAGSEIEPRFDWSVAPHYVDTDGDGFAEPANLTGTPVDNVLVGANDRLEVTLNACASLPAGGGGSIVRYLWSVDGDLVADLDHCEGPTIEVRSGERPTVRLDVRGDDGTRAITSREIAPRDLVVVSLGDSVASGEGSPLRERGEPGGIAWSDASCHRSPHAGPALAARQLEDGDPHTSVTFVQLACSGAAVVDTFEDPTHSKQPGDPDDPVTGGVSDEYAGVAHAGTCATGGPCPTLRPSQIDQMEQLLGARTADAVLVSVGANDVRFSDTVMTCIVDIAFRCDSDVRRQAMAHRMADLPRRYETLAVALSDVGVEPGRVYLTEYFDPTGDQYGVTNLRCIGRVEDVDDVNITGLGLVTDDEANWARTELVGGLNAAVHAAAAMFGWNVVGGIADRFARHGYWSPDPWIVRIGESMYRQGDLAGPFHPNHAGQDVYGDAIASRLAPLVQTTPTEPTATAPTGAAAVGDLVVMASTLWAPEPQLRSVALTTTGGRPHVGAVRVLQRGSGWGTVAVGGESSVGVWAGEHGAFAAQLGSRPNVAVRDVHLVQAATDNSRLVTNRKTIVLADLWSSVDGASTTSVTTTVVARDEAGDDTEVVAPRTEDVVLYPGRNEIQLPLLDTFDAPHDTVLIATVRVTDPAGATDEDSADNERSTLPGDFVPTIATRPVKVAIVALDFGGGTVSCATTATAANTWVAWAQQLLPVPEGGLQADLSCSPDMIAPSASASGVAQALGELDLLARVAGLDSVVGVVPDGWLGQALGDASVGRAGVTGRSMLLEAHAPATALAHELGHNLGLDHSDGRHAAGVWVSRSRLIDGTDFMAESHDGVSRHWVSGETWDLLTGSIHVGSERTPPQGGGTAYWVRGMIPVAGDSIALDPFIDDGDIPTLPPEGSDTSRLVVVPVAGDGDPVGPPVEIGLEPDVSLDGSGDSPRRFAQRVVAVPGTAAFRFLLDGAVVGERTLGTAPSVSVSSPSDGTVLGRNDTIDVEWTVDDPDTALGEAPPSIALLVSDDAGVNWRPLASGLTGTSASMPVPRDLGGAGIRVRVVAMDGVHVRWADSPAFEIASVASGREDRLVFVAGDPNVFEGERTQIGTMRPDGTDVRFLPLPTSVTDGNGTELFAGYASPVWGPDGERIYFASLVNADINCVVVDSVRADGTDRQREITPSGPSGSDCNQMRRWLEADTSPCLSMTPDGRRLLVGNLIFERGAGGWSTVGRLPYASNPLTPEWSGVLPFASNIAVQIAGNQCPTLSPDGTHVATVFDFSGTRSDLPTDDEHPAGWTGSQLAVAVTAVSLTWPNESPYAANPRVVTAWQEDLFRGSGGPDPRLLGVSWLSDRELLVARGTPGWDDTALERIDLTSVSRDDLYPFHAATSTPISTLNLPASGARHRDPKSTADGRLFGDVDCGVYIGDRQAVSTFRSTDIPGETRCFQEFDLGRTTIASRDRLVFVGDDPTLAQSSGFAAWNRIGTMAPDGSDIRFLPLPTRTTLFGSLRPAVYSSPVWGADGRIYFRSIESAFGGNACTVVDSVAEDGSDRRREVGATDVADCFVLLHPNSLNASSQCLSMSDDGTRMLVGAGVFERNGDQWTRLSTLDWGSSGSPPNWRGILPYDEGGEITSSSDQCAQLSPDGTAAARVSSSRANRLDDGVLVGYGSQLVVEMTSVMVGGVPASPWVAFPRVVSAWDETLYRPDGETDPDVRHLGVSWLNSRELLVSRGTPGWDAAVVERLDISTLTPASTPFDQLVPASSTVMSNASLPSSTARHRDAKRTPGGGVYGDVECGFYSGGATVTTLRSSDVPGEPGCYRDFSWKPVERADDLIAIDPDLAVVPDPEEPEVVTVGEGEPAPGAGSDAIRPRPTQVLPDSVTIEPGQVVEVVLVNELGAPAWYEVQPEPSIRPTAGAVTVFGDVDPSGLVTTTGPLLIGADGGTAWSTGIAQLRVRVAGADEFETLDVHISLAPAPRAVDDELTVRTGVDTVFPASALLANDVPSAPDADLELVQVVGYDGGEAFIDADGDVHVAADADGTGTFVYVVGEPASTALAVGSVTVTASSDTDPPVTDPPVTDPPVTDPPVTDPPFTGPHVTDPPVADPTSATSVPAPVPVSGQLPVTGGDQGRVATVAIWLCLGGLILVVIGTRRRRGANRHPEAG